jgi:predicted DNA-binding antitoxin AbrB/MazE fold protein
LIQRLFLANFRLNISIIRGIINGFHRNCNQPKNRHHRSGHQFDFWTSSAVGPSPFHAAAVQYRRRRAIMTHVEAIYHDGVFQPVEDVKLPENQRVRLSIEPVENGDITKWREWLAEVEEHQRRIIAERGFFPDSAISIAEDRRR